MTQDKIADEDTNPGDLRRLVANGWLQSQVPASDQLTAVINALNHALALTLIQQWSGDHWTLNKYTNAYAHTVWTLRGPDRCLRLQPHHRPVYAPNIPCQLMYELDPALDPLALDAPIRAAHLYWGREALAHWSPTNGFTADQNRWRMAHPDEGSGISHSVPVNFLPPHILLSHADGNLHGLATAGGMLQLPQSTSVAEHERFLTDAAKQLPDATHLDLIGQHLFTYVHDSPDPALPQLIGFRNLSGDIHQTITQTLNTCRHGIMRGDCDDLSEVYQSILTKQQRLAYVLSFPRHAACAWSEQRGDEWTTYVLQTGQPIAKHHAELANTVSQIYAHFDEHDERDGSMVNLLLRFAGENTRTPFRLSNRILTDADYAKTLIAVQHDLFYHTYAHGINTMVKMVAAGDHDQANYTELLGLYRHTAQWLAARSTQERIVATVTDPEQKLQEQTRLIPLLTLAQDHTNISNFVERALSDTLPTIAKENDSRAWWLAYHLHQALGNQYHQPEREKLFNTWLMPALVKETDEVRTWVNSANFSRDTWNNNLRGYRTQATNLIGIIQGNVVNQGFSALEQNEPLRKHFNFMQQWIQDFAFIGDGRRSTILQSYASCGFFAAQIIGEDNLDSLLASCSFPKAWRDDHRKRDNGFSQLRRDLPWIRCNILFWSYRMNAALQARDLPETRIRTLIQRLREAHQATTDLDLLQPNDDQVLLRANVIEALIGRDVTALDKAFTAYRDRQDKRSDAALCQTISSLARHLPPRWFTTVLQRWDAIAATKPGYYTIAWNCVHEQAIAQALVAGAFAAERLSDDDLFAEEFIYLQRVLAGGGEP